MGNRRLHKIERFHMLGMTESERLKVTALNLFHPTASPLLQEVGFFSYYDTSSNGERVG